MLRELKANEDEYYFEILHDTFPSDPGKGAIIVTDEINKISLPKSMIRICWKRGRDIGVIIPDWLARDRGII